MTDLMNVAERRFLVACDGNYGRASMSLNDEPDPSRLNKDKAEFYRRYAKYDIREVNGEEMRRLMLATVGVKL